MPNYDFRTLSPIDFEALTRDLLQEELSLTLESFKAGKDLGIDFRFAGDKDKTLIIQCKHYVESGFDALLHILVSKELKKISLLKPRRYIVTTSVSLGPVQKDKIVRALSPYILSPGDVFGKEDLNNLLGKNPLIERHTIKLWLISLPILEDVLHAGVRNISREELSRIKEHATLYVQNESFNEAARILEKHNFCIIAGIPGIGKTILAEMLVLHYNRAGYEVVKVSGDISEAWKLNQPHTKRVFYYDDFLGQTSFSEKLHKNEDQRIIDFIHAVRKSTGVKLILTTREYILQQAYQQYEKIDREGFSAQKCVIDLAKYTRINRAKILFNHIYFSELPDNYRSHLLKDRNYLKIIDHQNYSPRIVQLLTEHNRLREVPPSNYVDLFIRSMDNPMEVWECAFENHLSQAARNLLLILISMPHEAFMSDVEIAYQAYNLAYAKHFGSNMGPQDFRIALKELDGDFLRYDREGSEIFVHYQNPSVRDFVKQYLRTGTAEMALLVESIVFFEQLLKMWSWKDDEAGQIAIRRIVKEDSSWATGMMRRLMESSSCRVVRISRSGVTRREHWPHSLEKKVAVFAEIGTDCCAPLLDLVRETLPRIEVGMQDWRYERDGLADVVEALAIHAKNGAIWAVEFINVASEALLAEPESADDLHPICRLIKNCPDIVKEGTSKRLEKAVYYVVEKVAYNEWDLDADGLLGEAEALETLAEIIGIDIESDLHSIRERAFELERESGRYDEDNEYLSSSSSVDEIADDEVIASMFSTLNVSP